MSTDKKDDDTMGGGPSQDPANDLAGNPEHREESLSGSASGNSPSLEPSQKASGNGKSEDDDEFEKTVVARSSSLPQSQKRPPGASPDAPDPSHKKPERAALKVQAEGKRGQRKARKPVPVRPEQSIAMRLSALAMVILLITGASVYSEMPWLVTFLLIWLAMIGTLLAYLFREKRPFWVNLLPTVGAFSLVAYLVADCASQINLGQVNLLASFTRALAGFLALHCFDLRTRGDFSISTLIGLGLLVCTAGAANDLLFFLFILGYITCVSLLLYFDGVSRSREVGPSRPIGEGRPASLPRPTKRQARAATSIILIPVLSLPLLTIAMFFFMPRSSSLISWVLENAIRPYVAVSQSERTKGYSPGLGTGGTPSSRGSGGTGTGAAGGAGGDGGTDGEGNPNNSANPLDARTVGKGPRGLGKQSSGAGEPYREKVNEKPEKSSDVLPAPELSDQIVLRISAQRPGYVRRIAFDSYDGSSWSRSAPIKEVEFRLDNNNEFPVGNANAYSVPRDCPIVEVTQHITVDMPLSGGSLPAMWVPQHVAGPFGSITVQADGTLQPDAVVEPGTTYVVKSYLPVYRQSVMRGLPLKTHSDFKKSLLLPPVAEMEAAEKELMDKYLQLPDQLPARVKTKAKNIAGEGNWFVKSERICEYLHKKPFKYKNRDIYRVKGGDFVDNFVFKTKEGNCLDFASAFVVMARSAGIPARLVGGYLPGKFNSKTGFQEIKVRDGHAWVEIYLPNWSWIAFDPAPTGTLPEFQKDEGLLAQLAASGFANPFGGAFQGNRGTPGGGIGHGITGSKMQKDLAEEKRKKEGKAPVEEEDEGFDLIKRLSKLRWEPIAIFCILSTAAIVAFVIFQKQRASNAILIPPDAKKSTLLFFQVVRDLRKYKIVRLPTDTPLDLSARIHEGFELHRQDGKYVHPELEPLLTNFIEVYTLDRFGRGREDRINDLESMSDKIRKLVGVTR